MQYVVRVKRTRVDYLDVLVEGDDSPAAGKAGVALVQDLPQDVPGLFDPWPEHLRPEPFQVHAIHRIDWSK